MSRAGETTPPSGIITLLTDFGLSDPFVGVMTGAILSRFPAARVVDLCHGIKPQAVAEAAFWLERCYPWFPPGSVHVAVVDPGVGSARRILAAAIDDHYFLAPDNGLLGQRLLDSPGARVHAIELDRLGLAKPSATFHGRDVFAPVAAALARGTLAVEAVGDPARPKPCVLATPTRDGQAIVGEVVSVDRFGNLISNLDEALVEGGAGLFVVIGARRIPLHRTYSDVEPGELLALVNAFGVVEVAARDQSAELVLGIGRGAPLRLSGSSRAHAT